ncbi:MAG: hypothetical protein ACYC1L_13830 [Alphaproteobacteria bacterium]
MRAVFLVFAFLAAWAAPAVAERADPYANKNYEGTPGPMVYPAGEEPEWLPRLLKKLEKTRKPRELQERLVFRDANGPTHLVTTWGTGLFPEFLEIHRVAMRDGNDPAATFVYGLSAGSIHVLAPTGQDVFGDGVPTLFIHVAGGGSFILHDGVRIIRLERKPKDVTPKKYGNITNVGFIPGDDRRLFLIATDIRNSFNREICGTCYVMPETFLVWRDETYVPACRDAPDYYRRQMGYLRADYDEDNGEPKDFIGTRLGWAFDAAQIGQVDAAIREIKSAITEARRRGVDWPGWSDYRRSKPEEYDALISSVEGQFLPLLEKARRFSKTPCPLTAAQGPIRGSELDVRPILRTPLHDVR